MSQVFLGIIRVLLRTAPPLGLGPAGGQFVYAGLLTLVEAAEQAIRATARRGDPQG